MFSKYVTRSSGAGGANAEVQRIGSPRVSNNPDNFDQAISTGSTPPTSPKCLSEDTESGEDSYVIRAGARPVAVRGPHTQAAGKQLPGALARELLESQELCRKDMEQLRNDLGSLSNRIGMANTGASAQAAAVYAAEAGRRAQISELENRARAAESKLEAYSIRLCALEASPEFAEALPRCQDQTPHWGFESGTPKEPVTPTWAVTLLEAEAQSEVSPPAQVVPASVEVVPAVSAPLAASAQPAVSEQTAVSATAAVGLTPPATFVPPTDVPAAMAARLAVVAAELVGPVVAAAVARLAAEIREELTSNIIFFQDNVEKKMTALETGLDAVRMVSRKSSWVEQCARRAAPHEVVKPYASSGADLYARHRKASVEDDRYSSVPTMSPMASPTISRTSTKASGASPSSRFRTSRPDDWSELEVATERKRGCLI